MIIIIFNSFEYCVTGYILFQFYIMVLVLIHFVPRTI